MILTKVNSQLAKFNTRVNNIKTRNDFKYKKNPMSLKVSPVKQHKCKKQTKERKTKLITSITHTIKANNTLNWNKQWKI